MDEKKRKFPIATTEIICWVVLAAIVYFAGIMLIFPKEYNLPWRMISTRLTILIVLGLNVGWIVIMKPWKTNNTKLRFILTLAVLTLSAVVLTDLYLIHMWNNMW